MSYLFIISSAGDSALAIATINAIKKKLPSETIYVLPLTDVANGKVSGIKEINILEEKNVGASFVNKLIEKHEIKTAYIGVPSDDKSLPYEIAKALTIPCFIAYEYMYKEPKHAFFTALPSLQKDNITVAVPLEKAKDVVKQYAPEIKTAVVGHISLTKKIKPAETAKQTRFASLQLKINNPYYFISGTSKPIGTDSTFVEALLKELATNHHPTVQLRFGIHPGLFNDKVNFNAYLEGLINCCKKYENLHQQFKIVVNGKAADLIDNETLLDSPFVLRNDLSGLEMAEVADSVAQAVPGALTNNSAVNNELPYSHGKVDSYLSASLFAQEIKTFFSTPRQKCKEPNDIISAEKAGEVVAALMQTSLKS